MQILDVHWRAGETLIAIGYDTGWRVLRKLCQCSLKQHPAELCDPIAATGMFLVDPEKYHVC